MNPHNCGEPSPPRTKITYLLGVNNVPHVQRHAFKRKRHAIFVVTQCEEHGVVRRVNHVLGDTNKFTKLQAHAGA